MKIGVNPDINQVEIIIKAIAENEGYCPCAFEKNDDTRCMCKYFREEVKEGDWCHCGLYCKVKE